MTILHGADSSSPLTVPASTEVYGVYVAGATPHLWTGAEFRELGEHGVVGVMPIVVPSQMENWWETDDGAEELVRLVAGARAWGLHVGAPLCLDIEQHQAEAMGTAAQAVEERFANACATYGYLPWSYGGTTWHESVGTGHGKRWLASWTPEAPTEIPAGYDAVQYFGDPNGTDPDLDLFAPGTYFGMSGEPVDLPLAPVSSPAPSPEPEKETEPMSDPAAVPSPTPSAEVTAVESATDAEVAQDRTVESAVDAQVASVRADIAADDLAKARATAAELTTHSSEITTLAQAIAIHVAELNDLLKESPK